MDHIPARLETFLRSIEDARKVLIPGCGQDHRSIEAFHRAGHLVTAIDFSPVAVDAVTKALPGLTDHIVIGDFFAYKFQAAPFDLIYERTFLCSLPPQFWKDYSARAAQLLRPHGLLAGFFFYGDESDPPPYPLTENQATEIFGGRFDLQTSESVTDSLSVFDGKEKWQEWRVRER